MSSVSKDEEEYAGGGRAGIKGDGFKQKEKPEPSQKSEKQ